MSLQNPLRHSPAHEPRADVSAERPQTALLIRYAGCLGRVLSEVLTASGECAGYVPPRWPVVRHDSEKNVPRAR
jgi:hypothetical protein